MIASVRLKGFLPAVLLILAAACGGSTTAPGTGSGSGSGSGTLNATVDGVALNPTSVTAHLSLTTPPYLGVSASDAALDLFSFAMGPSSGNFGVGTYQIGASLNDAGNNANYVLPGGATIWTAVGNQGSGQLTITAFSAATKTVSGTFTFVVFNSGKGTKTITGSFTNLAYT